MEMGRGIEMKGVEKREEVIRSDEGKMRGDKEKDGRGKEGRRG